MVIIQVAGGLGNQLQQYALYREYIEMGIRAKLDFSWFQTHISSTGGKKGIVTQRKLELACFQDLEYEVCTEGEKAALIGTDGMRGKIRRKLFPHSIAWFRESGMYHPEVFAFRDMYISGYFACERYYADILPKLREELRFPVSPNPLNQKMAEEINNCQSVSVHIRRGDYLNPENAAMFGNICTDAYYETAMELVKRSVPHAHFYLFSDDIPYVEETYKGEQYTVVNINHGEDSFYDMWLMSRCKHNICANSTFSFWGARLNGNENKIMVRPTIHKNGQAFEPDKMKELWQGWRFVSPEGKEQ